MNLLHIVVILQFIFQVYGQNLVCQKEVWLPSDGSHYVSPGCEEYDGSLVPDCNYFLNNLTSYFHVHEYDCGKFWECSPSGPCLMKCATCEVSPECPDGTLEFDCRYQYPVGPVCDWPSAVNCTNDNPCDITQVECCSEYDCQPGELCVDGSCVSRSTPTPCPNECCGDEDCADGFMCDADGSCKCSTECCADSDCNEGFTCDENGNCVAECPNECCADSDCKEGFICDENGNCVAECPNECCADSDCKDGFICDENGNCVAECPNECCADSDCDEGFTCDENGNCIADCPTDCCSDEDCGDGFMCNADGVCECSSECCVDDDCDNGLTCVDGGCKCPNDCCSNDDCPNGWTCDAGSCSCPTECCSDDDCHGELTCNADGNCQCPNECCSDDDCEGDYICNDDGTCEPKGECGLDRPCDLANGVCDEQPYTTCEWCNFEDNSCNPGCETDDNCGQNMICANHICNPGPGVNGIVNITIKTASCTGCAGSSDPQGVVEGGVRLFLMGAYNTECTSEGLDNLELVDYKDGSITFFDGKPDDDGSDDGMGECKGHDMNYGLVGGSATWTGPGQWTGAASSPICIKFFDPDNNKPTCCCDLAIKTLDLIVDTTDLVNCSCEV